MMFKARILKEQLGQAQCIPGLLGSIRWVLNNQSHSVHGSTSFLLSWQ
jgi:hypothetical protein